MLFSSLPFLIFFAVYFTLHLLVPSRWRTFLIIAGSTIFYGYWDWRFTPLPFMLLAVASLGASWMDRTASQSSRKWRLAFVVSLLLLPLLFFKYANFLYRDVYLPFFPAPVSEPISLVGPFDLSVTFFPSPDKVISTVLPLGISFITFTFIGYVADIYRRVEGEERLEHLTSAVMFFPHLIAGPVVLPKQLVWQMKRPPVSASEKQWRGAALIFAVGLFKKLVLADQIALAVNPVFRDPGSWTAPDYLLAVFGFSMQIYCDFSGYSDMAVGISRFLGVRLPKNFERPYLSASPAEFWQRWHISLSSWLRNYLYIPLGGNRCGLGRQIFNIMITMALGGLWHGARWTFVVWGVAHGAAIAITHVLRRFRGASPSGAPKEFAVVAVFLFVTITWIPFRAESLSEAWRVLSGCFSAPLGNLEAFASKNAFFLGLLAFFFLTHRYDNLVRIRAFARKSSPELGWMAAMMIFVVAAAFGLGGSAEFIYFDF